MPRRLHENKTRKFNIEFFEIYYYVALLLWSVFVENILHLLHNLGVLVRKPALNQVSEILGIMILNMFFFP